jgi:hypothetical protein
MAKIFPYSPRRAQAELRRRQRFARVREAVQVERAIWSELYAEEATKQANKPPKQRARKARDPQAEAEGYLRIAAELIGEHAAWLDHHLERKSPRLRYLCYDGPTWINYIGLQAMLRYNGPDYFLVHNSAMRAAVRGAVRLLGSWEASMQLGDRCGSESAISAISTGTAWTPKNAGSWQAGSDACGSCTVRTPTTQWCICTRTRRGVASSAWTSQTQGANLMKPLTPEGERLAELAAKLSRVLKRTMYQLADAEIDQLMSELIAAYQLYRQSRKAKPFYEDMAAVHFEPPKPPQTVEVTVRPVKQVGQPVEMIVRSSKRLIEAPIQRGETRRTVLDAPVYDKKTGKRRELDSELAEALNRLPSPEVARERARVEAAGRGMQRVAAALSKKRTKRGTKK